MVQFSQGASGVAEPAAYFTADRGFNASPTGPPNVQFYAANDRGSGAGVLSTNTLNKPTVGVDSFNAEEATLSTPGADWFEAFHVVPRSFDLGNLLSAQSLAIEVFSAHRKEAKPWNTFTAPSNSGITLGSAPGLPVNVDPLYGYEMTVEISSVGSAIVDGTLDFDFGALGIVSVPIELQRIVLFGLEPEAPFEKVLQSLTKVYDALDGTEKRESLRSIPRDVWRHSFIIDEGEEAQRIENIVFDFHGRVFGLPLREEGTKATAAITTGDSTISVASTEFRDFYVGGLVAIISSQTVFDVVEVLSLTTSSLTFTAQLLNDYDEGVDVFPLETCFANPQLSGARWPVNLKRLSIDFEATASTNYVGDLSAFDSYNGKLLLSGVNSLKGATKQETFIQRIADLDGGAGQKYRAAYWDRNKRSHPLVLRAEGREAIWNLRQLAHALRGRLTSFYIARDSDDLLVVADLLNATNTIDVEGWGYTQFVRSRSPRAIIRLTFSNGDPPLIRQVVSAAASSATVDTLTLDSNWTSTVAFEDVARCEYVEEVRFDSDDVVIRYHENGYVAHLEAPLRTLF